LSAGFGKALRMAEDSKLPRRTLSRVRTLLWILVALAIVGTAALLLIPRGTAEVPATQMATQTSFAGPFTLVGGDGKPFSSVQLAGKPYAIYFGFTNCGDVCPTTLARLVKLRQQAGDADALNIVFVTIDPARDGPKEVGQYAGLFNSPIIGLTGASAQIDRVKKQYGIFAQPSAHPMPGKEMEHTATVLLFDDQGKPAGTIATDESDSAALGKLKRLTA
jgi:protein SCO1/2